MSSPPCSHPGCLDPAEAYNPDPDEDPAHVQFWCADHAFEGGFCHSCGELCAGQWEFLLSGSLHLCGSCQRYLARAEHAEEPDDDCLPDEP